MTMTAKDETYEGWSNRETWAANLWLSNDEGLYHQTRSMAEEALQAARDDEGDIALDVLARHHLATELRTLFEEWEAEVVDGNANRELRLMVTDIGSLYRIDFHEMAEGWIADAIAESEEP